MPLRRPTAVEATVSVSGLVSAIATRTRRNGPAGSETVVAVPATSKVWVTGAAPVLTWTAIAASVNVASVGTVTEAVAASWPATPLASITNWPVAPETTTALPSDRPTPDSATVTAAARRSKVKFPLRSTPANVTWTPVPVIRT